MNEPHVLEPVFLFEEGLSAVLFVPYYKDKKFRIKKFTLCNKVIMQQQAIEVCPHGNSFELKRDKGELVVKFVSPVEMYEDLQPEDNWKPNVVRCDKTRMDVVESWIKELNK
jgi:monomeric isocitrate dehydrogenase